MARHPLPSPKDCTWIDAEVTAEVLEALADELAREMPTVKPVSRWGWRESRQAEARRQGQRLVIDRIRYRAFRYRSRQYELRKDA